MVWLGFRFGLPHCTIFTLGVLCYYLLSTYLDTVLDMGQEGQRSLIFNLLFSFSVHASLQRENFVFFCFFLNNFTVISYKLFLLGMGIFTFQSNVPLKRVRIQNGRTHTLWRVEPWAEGHQESGKGRVEKEGGRNAKETKATWSWQPGPVD